MFARRPIFGATPSTHLPLIADQRPRVAEALNPSGISPRKSVRTALKQSAIPYGARPFCLPEIQPIAIGYGVRFDSFETLRKRWCHTLCHRVCNRVWRCDYSRSTHVFHTLWHTLCLSRVRAHARARAEKLQTTTRVGAFRTQLAWGGGCGGRAASQCRDRNAATARLRLTARAWDKPKPQTRPPAETSCEAENHVSGTSCHRKRFKPAESKPARTAAVYGMNGGCNDSSRV